MSFEEINPNELPDDHPLRRFAELLGVEIGQPPSEEVLAQQRHDMIERLRLERNIVRSLSLYPEHALATMAAWCVKIIAYRRRLHPADVLNDLAGIPDAEELGEWDRWLDVYDLMLSGEVVSECGDPDCVYCAAAREEAEGRSKGGK